MKPSQQACCGIALAAVRPVEHRAADKWKYRDDASVVLERERAIARAQRREDLGDLGRGIGCELVRPSELVERPPSRRDPSYDGPVRTLSLDDPGFFAATKQLVRPNLEPVASFDRSNQMPSWLDHDSRGNVDQAPAALIMLCTTSADSAESVRAAIRQIRKIRFDQAAPPLVVDAWRGRDVRTQPAAHRRP